MALGMLANMPKTFNISPKDKEKIALIFVALGKGKFQRKANNLHFLTNALNFYRSTLGGNC